MRTYTLCFFYLMTKGLEQIKFLCFCIMVKRRYINSVILGSLNQISIKVGISDYQTRKFINYGLKNGLISKTKGGFKVSSYKEQLKALNLTFDSKYLFLMRFGSFNELVERNLYLIARNNFKQQAFNIKKNNRLTIIKRKIETDYYISKRDLKFYYAHFTKSVLSSKKIIVTGQKKISQILGVSKSFALFLLKRWNELKFIKREVSFSKSFDRFEDNNILRLEIGNFKCDGSVIKYYI